jgi:hypothetical protein
MPGLGRFVLAIARIGFNLCRYLPAVVSDDEIIVRAIFSPYHVDVNKAKLKPGAFEPTPGTDEVSVMRSSILGPHRCKKRARAMEKPASNKVYRGFAVLSVRAVRAASIGVVDSRNGNFLGHADLKTGTVTPPKGVPREPAELARTQEIRMKLIAQSKYCSDPLPSVTRWKGKRLVLQGLA